jgi:hypothetical protein
VVGDIVEVIAYNYTVGAFTGVGGSGTTNYIPKWTASGTLGNSLIFDNGTSIGIGTSNPSGAAGLALVLNSGTSQGRICIKTSSTGDTSGAGLQIVMSGVDASIEQRENAALTFATNASERLRITSSGNVGIGTTNPNSILEIKTSTATNSIRLGVIANDNTFNMISLNGTNTEGQYVGLAGGGGTDTNLFYQSGNGGDHRFRTGNGTSYTERLRITNTGNVGIGTTSPGSRFDVRVISGDSNQMRISADTNTYKDMQWYDTTNGRMWILSHRIGSDGNKLMAWYNNGTSYNSSPALTIDTNNNVGINTSNPSRRLHISASVSGVFEGILVENTASSSYSLYQCKTGSSSVWQWGVWNDNGYRVGISGVGDFLLMNTNGQIRLPNQPSFKYGIGSKTITSVTRFGTDWGFGVLTDRDTVDSSYFNKANGRFTAPVAGTYIFGCTIMRSGNTGTGPVDFQIVKNEPNPISQSSASTYGRGYVGSYSADYQQITITATIKLAVNDYIALDFSGNMSTYDDDSWFYGYFLG